MADRPILFSAPMVQALLRECRAPGTGKTQTRRKTKQPKECFAVAGCAQSFPGERGSQWWEYWSTETAAIQRFKAPHAVGDRLWVREAHYLTDNGHAEYAVYAADQDAVADHIAAINALPAPFSLELKARHLKRRPGIHMPRWASRITLHVAEVRIEPLNKISKEDAKAEGLSWVAPTFGIPGLASSWHGDPVCSYAALWDAINGDGAWRQNPWVIATTFKPVLANIDSQEAQAA